MYDFVMRVYSLWNRLWVNASLKSKILTCLAMDSIVVHVMIMIWLLFA